MATFNEIRANKNMKWHANREAKKQICVCICILFTNGTSRKKNNNRKKMKEREKVKEKKNVINNRQTITKFLSERQ